MNHLYIRYVIAIAAFCFRHLQQGKRVPGPRICNSSVWQWSTGWVTDLQTQQLHVSIVWVLNKSHGVQAKQQTFDSVAVLQHLGFFKQPPNSKSRLCQKVLRDGWNKGAEPDRVHSPHHLEDLWSPRISLLLPLRSWLNGWLFQCIRQQGRWRVVHFLWQSHCRADGWHLGNCLGTVVINQHEHRCWLSGSWRLVRSAFLSSWVPTSARLWPTPSYQWHMLETG